MIIEIEIQIKLIEQNKKENKTSGCTYLKYFFKIFFYFKKAKFIHTKYKINL
jgi:hypothetical protein